MADTIATWDISLDCDCPRCTMAVNLIDYPDFWHGHQLDLGEHNTERTKGMEVTCPACNHEFTVDCEY